MIIGIWRAKRNPEKSLEEYVAFQRDVVVPGMKKANGCLGALNFHSDEEWGTIQLWESREIDLAEDTSPYAHAIYEALQASGLMPRSGESSYEWFEVHNGFTAQDLLKQHLK